MQPSAIPGPVHPRARHRAVGQLEDELLVPPGRRVGRPRAQGDAVPEAGDADLIRLWGMRSDGPDNAEILSFARAVLALRPSAPRAPLTDEQIDRAIAAERDKNLGTLDAVPVPMWRRAGRGGV